MQSRWIVGAVVLSAVLGSCGGGESGEAEVEAETTERAAPERNPTTPARGPQPRENLKELEQQAGDAAAKLTGVNDADLLPSEQGAEYLVDRGYIDPDRFCAADAALSSSELGPEAEGAFEAGWDKTASAELEDMGVTMYNALWAVYCLPG